MEITKRQLQIIEAAGKLLTEGGIHNLTTKKLAQEMKFSEAALYRHFKNKDDIIFAMLNFLASNINKRVTDIATSDKSAKDKITILFDNQFNFFNQNKHYLSAVFSDGLWEQSENIHNAVKTIMSTKHKHLKHILEQGVKNNEFTSKLPSDSLIHMLMGTFRLHMLKWKMSDFKYDLVKSGNQIIADYLELIKV